MTTQELFIGHFTGALSTLTTKTGLRLSFKPPYPRIEKGKAYTLQFNQETGSTRLIPIVTPSLVGLHERIISTLERNRQS